MAELLLELLSAEIPARMQQKAQLDLKDIFALKLKEREITFATVESYVTARRLVLYAEGIPLDLAASKVEKKGPKVAAAESAINGFLKSTGLSLNQLEKRIIGNDEFYFAVSITNAKKTAELLQEIVNEIIANFSWPKSMRWGAHKMRWVRPLENMLCVFDGQILPVCVGHLAANNNSRGHRFLGKEFTANSFKEYQQKLAENYVILSSNKRKEIILEQANKLGNLHDIRLKNDEPLLNEVAGLVEWPQALLGKIDQQFLSMPKEVLITSMRTHQKYFSFEDKNGQFSSYFMFVSNMQAIDDGAQIIAGNERVLRARLSDAKFFYEQDITKTLSTLVEYLSKVTFHAKLGSVFDKVTRIKQLAVLLPGDKTLIERACHLCKADLLTQMVGEFPELQGIMGYYYAIASNEDELVATAIRDHYSPLGPKDQCPSDEITCAVAIADKLDSIVGLFVVGEKPTGSKDPYALRRAALGVIRIILENKLSIDLKTLIEKSASNFEFNQNIIGEVLEFFADRLKHLLKAENVRHDIITSVFNHQQSYNLYKITARAKALQQFLVTATGKELLAAYKRASNIVVMEEGKDLTSYKGLTLKEYLIEQEEKILFDKFEQVMPTIKSYITSDNYVLALNELEHLRDPINNFFDKVLVNVDNPNLRKNRLLLLSNIRTLLEVIADFSLIEG